MTSFLLDLIRHGKAHQSPKQADGNSDSSLSSTAPTIPRSHKEQREPKPAKQQEPPKSPPASYQKEAEIIVQEERQAKSKMPVYKGLERFKLLDKMGEYVSLADFHRPLFTCFPVVPFPTSTKLRISRLAKRLQVRL